MRNWKGYLSAKAGVRGGNINVNVTASSSTQARSMLEAQYGSNYTVRSVMCG